MPIGFEMTTWGFTPTRLRRSDLRFTVALSGKRDGQGSNLQTSIRMHVCVCERCSNRLNYHPNRAASLTTRTRPRLMPPLGNAKSITRPRHERKNTPRPTTIRRSGPLTWNALPVSTEIVRACTASRTDLIGSPDTIRP